MKLFLITLSAIIILISVSGCTHTDKYDLSRIEITGNGTEPFWGFTSSETQLTWREATPTGPMSSTPYSVTITQTPTIITITNPNISAILTLQVCSDGMSDIVYTHKAIVTKGDTTFNGCANISS